MEMYLPVLVVVVSNTLYHICAKSTPAGMNAFASLSVTYMVAAVSCLFLYMFSKGNGSTLITEYKQLNWSSFLLGLCIIGLEAGFMWMYKVGWEVSTAQTVASALLAITLLVVGYLLFKEVITIRKIAGVGICLIGLYVLNK
ncbi:MAG: EamA family transporter [Blautia sp.]|nr:EamA family transporter [Blautia sp.]